MPKIVIQDDQTRKFYARNDEWVEQPGDAADFGTALNAIAFAMQQSSCDHSIVVIHEDGTRTSVKVGAEAPHEPTPGWRVPG